MHFQRPRENQDQEGAGSRPVKAVVGPDHKRRRKGWYQKLLKRKLRLLLLSRIRLAAKNIKRHHRKDHHHQRADHRLVHAQGDPCSRKGSQRGDQAAGQRQLPLNQPAFRKTGRRHNGAGERAELGGPQDHMHRDARQKIGRKRDQPASAGNGIHKTR